MQYGDPEHPCKTEIGLFNGGQPLRCGADASTEAGGSVDQLYCRKHHVKVPGAIQRQDLAFVPFPESRPVICFLTGSRAYGTPRPDSDTDLACLVDQAALDQLRSLADKPDKTQPTASDYSLNRQRDQSQDPGDSLRFGRLNLLCFTSQAVFEAWREATRELISERPVTRDAAKIRIKSRVQQVYAYRDGNCALPRD